MKLYSDTLTIKYLDAIADSMGMELYEADDYGIRTRGKYAGKRYMKFTLRPQRNEAGEKIRLIRNNGYNGNPRRVWAVSWYGHAKFMQELFNRDNKAILITQLATYDGLFDFLEKFDATGTKNIGSVMEPLLYADATHHLLDE